MQEVIRPERQKIGNLMLWRVATTLCLSSYLLLGFCSNLKAADPLLAKAAELQDAQAVQRLLLQGEDPSRAQVDGMTALHWSILYSDDVSISRLLIAGANPSARTRYGVTPLSIACESCDAKIVRQLLLSGADPSFSLPGKVTPLMLAARANDVESVRLLLRAGANVSAKQRDGQTALMWAASEGAADVIDELIEAGANLEQTTWVGFNALMFAARDGQIEAVERLIAAGAEVNATTGEEKRGGERGPRPRTSPLIMAVESAHYELALRLVQAGADPNDQRCGFAPLHVLSWTRRPERGDNPNGDPPPRGSGDVSPLRFVHEMVAAGANANLRLESGTGGDAVFNPKGATPFLMAAKTADLPLMKTLLAVGADPLAVTDDETTALMATAGVGVIAVGEFPGTVEEVCDAIRLLVKLGVSVNAVDKNQQTAMHGAAYRNYPEAVTLLAELGADPKVWDIPNHHNSRPEQIAQGKRPGSLKPSPETIAALQVAKQVVAAPSVLGDST